MLFDGQVASNKQIAVRSTNINRHPRKASFSFIISSLAVFVFHAFC